MSDATLRPRDGVMQSPHLVVALGSRGGGSVTQAIPGPFASLQPMLWRCPRCATTLLTRRSCPRCPRCGYFEDE